MFNWLNKLFTPRVTSKTVININGKCKYKNNQKLSDEEAKEILDETEEQFKEMDEYFKEMNKIFKEL